jgi:hypothetical protein
MDLEESFEKYIEWKFYKILYLGALVPLLFQESKKWILEYPAISIIYLITIIILLLPLLFKICKLIEWFREKLDI